jgi:GntR family transcriptional regulator
VPIEPDSHADATLSQRIAHDLRTSIDCGDYPPGHRLPSGRALMRQYSVARQTVQNAFDLLRGEGLIITRTGAGAFVRDRPPVLRLARSRPVQGRLAQDTKVTAATTRAAVTTRTEPADEHSADALGLAPGEELLVRERVMHADGAPVHLATSRLPKKLAIGPAAAATAAAGATDAGAGDRLAELDHVATPGHVDEADHVNELDHVSGLDHLVELDHFVEYVSTRPAKPAEATSLMLASGSPVLCVTRIAFDRRGIAVELNDMVLPGERYQLVYEIPAY